MEVAMNSIFVSLADGLHCEVLRSVTTAHRSASCAKPDSAIIRHRRCRLWQACSNGYM